MLTILFIVLFRVSCFLHYNMHHSQGYHQSNPVTHKRYFDTTVLMIVLFEFTDQH